MSLPDLVAAVRQADAEHGLFASGETVVVGVSGGPDSVALLDALRAFAPERGLRLHVGHLDHMLRPASTDDAAWVAGLAEEWAVPATLGARDVRHLAADSGRGIEEAGRVARYAFLAAVALRSGAAAVAVAHTADDQAETVFMHFLRGSGLAGLRGMAPGSAYPLGAEEIAALEDVRPTAGPRWPPRLVRPLLEVPRPDVEAWLAARGLAPRVDATNADPAFLRNRVRREVFPLLEAINPRLRETLRRNAAAVAGDLDFIERAVAEIWPRLAEVRADRVLIAGDAWSALHPALQRRVLRRAVAELAGGARDVGWEHVEAARRAMSEDAGSLALPGGLRLRRDAGGFTLASGPPAIPSLRLSAEVTPLAVPGEARLPGGWAIGAEARPARPSDVVPPRDRWQAWLDGDAVGAGLGVRARRPGDRIQPLGLGGRHKSLQDLFVDGRVPQALRDGWPVVVAGDQVVWVPGLRLDERARVRPDTRRLVILRVRPPAGVE